MNKERLYPAIDAITDKQGWGIFKVWSNSYEGSIYPEYITKREAIFLKLVGRLFSEEVIPYIVLQWAGEDGMNKFKKELGI